AVQPRLQAQVLARAQLPVQQRLVGEQPDPAPHRPGLLGKPRAEHAHVAPVRAKQRREHAQQRRLAGAVGTEHHQRLPLRERQRDIRQRLALTVVPSEALELERVHPQALDTCGARSRCARAISSRTACSSPLRRSDTGSGSPPTIPSKNSLRSWYVGSVSLAQPRTSFSSTASLAYGSP